MVKSPCNSVCRLDEDNKFCIGCHRTTNEIKDWKYYSSSKKSKLINELRSRTSETKKIGYYGNTI